MKKISSLHVDNFRAFRSLNVDGLGDVNLFVGKNNTGKTTLLEALNLYFSEDNYETILELLVSREEYHFGRGGDEYFRGHPSGYAFDSLFYGRPTFIEEPYFYINTDHTDGGLGVRSAWIFRHHDESTGSVRYEKSLFEDDYQFAPDVVPGLEIFSGARTRLVPMDRIARRIASRMRVPISTDRRVAYLPSSGMSISEIGLVWDRVVLTDDEDLIVGALKTIIPTLERIVLVQSPAIKSERILMAKLRNFSNPVPFRSLGEGVVHIMGVALALIQARGGVLLADEIENGVHYSAQEVLWKLIFEQSKEWGTQVFATTHSWDCVLGFASVAPKHLLESNLFRLEGEDGLIRAVNFGYHEVILAHEHNIEVR